jgi:hypothetical protein
MRAGLARTFRSKRFRFFCGLLVSGAILLPGTARGAFFGGSSVEGVHLRDGVYYARGVASVRTESALSRTNARMAAETEAVRNLLNYIRFSDLEVDDAFADRRGQIYALLNAVWPTEVRQLEGLSVVSSDVEQHEAWCVVSLPANHANRLEAKRGHISDLLAANIDRLPQAANPALIFELIHDRAVDVAEGWFMNWLGGDLSLVNLSASIRGDALVQIPAMWWIQDRDAYIPDLSRLSVRELLELLDGSLMINQLMERLYAELVERGYPKFAGYLAISLASSPPDPQDPLLMELMVRIQERAKDLRSFPGSGFVKTVVEQGGFFPIAERGSASSEKWRDARTRFDRGDSDYFAIYNLCLLALMDVPSADGFNLAGRSLELAEYPQEASLVYWGQAYSMNPEHPYAGDNIRRILRELADGN